MKYVIYIYGAMHNDNVNVKDWRRENEKDEEHVPKTNVPKMEN